MKVLLSVEESYKVAVVSDCHEEFGLEMRFIKAREGPSGISGFKVGGSDASSLAFFVYVFRVVKALQMMTQHIRKFQS